MRDMIQFILSIKSRNIILLLCFTFWDMFLLLTPVTIPFFSSFNLSMKQILFLQSAFAFSMAICEIPSGFLADVWGRKKMLLFGSTLRAIAFGMLPFVSSFEAFVFFEILYGISTSFVSGTNISLLYEILRREFVSINKNSSYLGLMNGIALFSEALAAILGGVLANASFGSLAIVASVVNWLPFLSTLFIKVDDKYSGEKMSFKQNLLEIKAIFKNKDYRIIFAATNSILIGLVTYSLIWPIQKKWLAIHIPLYYFGVLTAAIGMLVSFGSLFIGRIEKYFNIRKITFGAYFFAALGCACLLSSNLIIVLSASIFLAFSRILQLSNDNLLYTIAPQDYLATLVSVVSFSFRLIFFLIAPLIGYYIDSKSLSSFFGVIVGTVLFSMVFFLPSYARYIKR